MSEGWMTDGPAVASQDPASTQGPSAGALLRQARESAGLHVAALAVALKVPVSKLEALEGDRWDLLPDMVFARGLASSVCRTLKVDPQPVLERLPRTTTPRLGRDEDSINTPFRAPGDGAPPTWLDQLTRPVFLAVFALLLGALVLILLPMRLEKERAATTTSTTTPSVPMLPASAAQNVASEPFPPASMAQIAAAAPSEAMPAASTPAAPAASAVAMPASAPAAVAEAAAGAASGLVTFRTTGPSWVEVTDAKGGIALRKQMAAGESAGASGPLPLRVTVGRVDNTAVQVRGKAFDMRAVSRDNVARFEVK